MLLLKEHFLFSMLKNFGESNNNTKRKVYLAKMHYIDPK